MSHDRGVAISVVAGFAISSDMVDKSHFNRILKIIKKNVFDRTLF